MRVAALQHVRGVAQNVGDPDVENCFLRLGAADPDEIIVDSVTGPDNEPLGEPGEDCAVVDLGIGGVLPIIGHGVYGQTPA
jgi:hypothetical protein